MELGNRLIAMPTCLVAKEKVSSIEVPLKRCGHGHEANLSRRERLGSNCCLQLGEDEVDMEIQALRRQRLRRNMLLPEANM